MPAKEVRALKRIPQLFCLVDATAALDVLPAMVAAGVDGFQVRAKSLSDGALVYFTRQVVAAVRPSGATVIVNDRVDIALATGADGVHLGADDLTVADARALAPNLIVGGTCRDRNALTAARAAGADYAGFGPIFATSSKHGLPDPLGTEALAAAVGILPLIAIGGIDAKRVDAVRAAGAHGVAVIGAIWNAPDPVEAAAQLSAATPR